ncbi:MAG: DNA mismatch repair endonuclease MutL [Caldilineaceae bacterium]
MTIQLLAPDVAAKIAAGEVVERPANVAKELLENSLDAGATEIRVEIREGGQRLLRVIDNGHGMTGDEAPLALLRHATSKLHTADDLNHIVTFGFRGEALYSIAAVSQVLLTTRHAQEPFGLQLRVEGGEIVAQQRAGAPVGTIVSVEQLFYNVPARKKFLRKAATEAGQISAVVQHYALAYPERRFSFVNDGKLVFQSTGSGDLFDVLVKVYGLDNAKQMVGVGAERKAAMAAQRFDDLAEDVDFMAAPATTATPSAPTGQRPIQVYGYVSLPTLTRANRSNIDLFVNRRYVEDRSLTHAVVQAYHTLLPGGRFPLAVIFVEIAPEEVDVNVHPQKVQVRFVDERAVFGAVQKVVRQAVVTAAPVPDFVLPGTERSGEASSPGLWQGALTPGAASTTGESRVETTGDLAGWSERRRQLLNAGQRQFDMYVPSPALPAAAAATTTTTATDEPVSLPSAASQGNPAIAQREVEVTPHPAQLPPLRVVGQVGAMYIVAEGPEGMYLIDQHAAHERILYEKYMAQRYGTVAGAVPQQHLLEPLTLHIGHELTGLVSQHLEQLISVGFAIEPFGGDTFLVRAVPSVLSGQDPLRVLEEIVTSLAGRRNLVGEELEARMVKMICKRASIKGGQLLSGLEMQELVRQLEACQSPRTCPHGRPTMIQLSAGELEKAFGRI